MFGRVFSILGIKNEYFDDAYKLYKVRCVFQGSNVRTKTKTSTADLFEEPGSAPASVVAARTEIGVAALRGFNAFLRDADTAYLQADSWCKDGNSREILKYDKPHCRLLSVLCGHPEAEALWEAALNNIITKPGWSSVPRNGGVYIHAITGAAIVVYVDHMLLLASPRDTDGLLCDIEKSVQYKDPAAPF